MLGIRISHLYLMTLLRLIVGRGQIANFGKKTSSSFNYYPAPVILKNLDNFPMVHLNIF